MLKICAIEVKIIEKNNELILINIQSWGHKGDIILHTLVCNLFLNFVIMAQKNSFYM